MIILPRATAGAGAASMISATLPLDLEKFSQRDVNIRLLSAVERMHPSHI